MALALSLHHSAQRPKTARAEREARDAPHGHVPEAPLPQGGRPAPLSEVAGSQTRVLRHAVGHLCVLALDVPVSQMVDQFPDIEQFFRALSPDLEQVVEVPKILPSDVPMRAAMRVPQMAEQLVKCRRSYPIPLYSGLWSSTSTFQFLVVEDQVLVFKVFPPDRVQQRCLPRNAFLSGLWSRSLIFLFQVEVFMVLSQDKVHLLLTLQLVLKSALMSLVKGFFARFPKFKKERCEAGFALESESARQCQPIHAGCSAGGRALAGLHRVGAVQGRQR